ncbi:MAG: tetratricopeptide repeat protein [Candidatus Kapaibacterium sp.]
MISARFDANSHAAQLEKRLIIARDSSEKLALLRSFLLDAYEHDPAYAIGLADEAFRVAMTADDVPAMADALYHRGLCNLALSSHDMARADFRESYNLFLSADRKWETAMAALAIGNVEGELGDVRQALSWYQMALDRCSGTESREAEAKVLEAFGNAYSGLGDYAKALHYFLRCLAIQEEMNDVDGIGVALSTVGRLYGLTGDYDAAFDYFTRGLEYFRRSGNRYQEVKALTNLGSVHYSRGELEIALEYSLTALTIYEALEDKSNFAATLASIGKIYEQIGEFDVALECQGRALHALEGVDDHHLHVSVLLSIGNLYQQTGAYNDALIVCEQALRIAQEIDEPRLQYQLHEALSHIQEELGDPPLALHHYKLFAQIRHELAGQEKQKSIAELQVRFDMEKAEREREIYRLKAAQLESEMQSKQNEVTAMALNLVQKNELLDTLKSQIKQLPEIKKDSGSQLVDRIMQDIDNSRGADDNWKIFEQQLDTVHHDFIRILSERFPTLTPTEQKICSLTKINLSTKDIANLLYTSVRTIEVHRYNIRRKLGITSGTSLSTSLAAL